MEMEMKSEEDMHTTYDVAYKNISNIIKRIKSSGVFYSWARIQSGKAGEFI